jgi:hypothetical protein
MNKMFIDGMHGRRERRWDGQVRGESENTERWASIHTHPPTNSV